MKLISFRIHCEKELREKLINKFPNKNTEIEKVIELLKDEEVLNDKKYVEVYINMRIRKGYGINRILVELKSKGIDSMLLQNIISELEYDEVPLIQRYILKKQKLLKPNLTQKEKSIKLINFLFNRGFSMQNIQECINFDLNT